MTENKINPRQHDFGEAESPPAPVPSKHRQTGQGTAPPELDVADPHPSNEEHPYKARHPGGAHPPIKDIGPNSAIHGGEPPPRPDNASTTSDDNSA
ncbi:MAG: hypothetical protein EOP22_08025 [Hyphomicrobiales bacterium]|nr:MAG: hypothetical protein EOP22_08025 [Hyphomicrobiales bacterium]